MNTNHSRELRIATMRAGLTVTAQTSDLRKIEAEFVLKPVNGVARASREDLDEVVTG